jgi:hypothetical protein
MYWLKYLEILIIIILVFIISKYVTDVSFEHNPKIIDIFDEELYKLIFLILIIGISYYSAPIGILLATAFVILLINIPKLMEKFSSYGPPLNNCNNYNKENSDKLGGSFYPLNENEESDTY